MKNVVYPSNFFDRPFADTGNKQIIPENPGSAQGRASLINGFPTETQLPLNQGGIAPNRLDFNGILNMLSAMAFWQQSGGQWQWNSSLNYKSPCIVFYSGKLWWCLATNGPNTAAGVQVPSATTTTYWQEFLQALNAMSPSVPSSSGNPVGTVITFWGTTAPDGYLPCDGSTFSRTDYPSLYTVLGMAKTPDMRGLFIRGYDPTGVNDKDGSVRVFGDTQGDAIRNITGYIYAESRIIESSGVFSYGTPTNVTSHDGGSANAIKIQFDASTVVPTALENRPKNINLLYCIKHD